MNTQCANVKFRTGTNGSVTREAHYKIRSSGRVKVRYSRAEDDNGYDLPNAQHCEWTNAGNTVEACKVTVKLALDCLGEGHRRVRCLLWGEKMDG